MKRTLLLVCLLVAGTLSGVYAQSLRGTIRVGGANADYPTLAAVLSDLKTKGGSNFTLQLQGTFYETFKIGYVEFPDVGGSIKITGGTIISSDPQETVCISDYGITIEGVTIKNTSATGSALHLTEGCGFSTVKNCQLQSNGGAGLKMTEFAEINTIKDNTIIGGEYGIYAASSSEAIIENNSIEDFKKAGIYTTSRESDIDHNGYTIRRNYISSNQISGQVLYGIWINEYSSPILIEHNEMFIGGRNTAVSYGINISEEIYDLHIHLNYIEADNPMYLLTPATITNNTLLSYRNDGIGLYIAGSSTMVNNEISTYSNDCIRIMGGSHTITNVSTFIENSAQSAACLRILNGSANVRNSSFYNSSSASSTYAIYVTENGKYTGDYNNFYSLSEFLGRYQKEGSIVNYLPFLWTWKMVSGQDANSISADPEYMDPELASTQIFTTSPLVGRALASIMPRDDRSTNLRQYNAIGAWDPSQPYMRSGTFNVEQTASAESTEITINDGNTITVSSSAAGEIQLQIVNMVNQQIVVSRKVVLTPENNQQIIDISGYPSGYYIVNITNGEESVSKKFSKK